MQLQDIIPDKGRLFLDTEVPDVYKMDYSYNDVAPVRAVALPNTTKKVVDLVKFNRGSGSPSSD